MPRGVKGTAKTTSKKKTAAPVEQKTRKPYPTYEERLVAVDAQIARLTKLNAERSALIAKTEAKLNERKDTLSKSTEALEKAVAKKAKIEIAMSKPAPAPKAKLTEEERAEARKAALAKAREVRAANSAAKKAEKAKMEELLLKLKEQGKSVDDLLSDLDK